MYSTDQVEIVKDITMEEVQEIIEFLERADWADVIGKGASAEVYAYGKYAIKVPLAEGETDDDIKPLKALNHLSCTVNLYAIIDNKILITELIEGRTLRDYAEWGDYDWFEDDRLEEFEELLVDILNAGYNPHDLHECNIMLDEVNDRLVVVDLGWFTPLSQTEYTMSSLRNGAYNAFEGFTTAFDWAGKALRCLVNREEYCG